VIVVTGATGNVGSSAVRELVRAGQPVRAFVRDREKGRALLGGRVELAVGDLGDEEAIRRAVTGADALLVSTADGPDKPAWEMRLIDEAARAGVGRVVKVSTVLAEAGSPLPTFDWNGLAEDHLRATGLPWTILRSCFYMTNFLAWAEPIAGQGVLPAPAGEGKVATIDPADTGAVASVVLTRDGHAGMTYTLSGPEAITFGAAAEELSAVLGREVRFVDVPEESVVGQLRGTGAPEWLVVHLPRVFRLIREGSLSGVTTTVRDLLGRGPRTFGEFVRDHAAAFGASVPAG